MGWAVAARGDGSHGSRKFLEVRERHFEQLLQNSFDAVVILDAEGVQRYVSASAEKVHGYSSAELVDIPVIEQMIHPDDQAQVRAAFRQIVETGYGGAEYRHRCKGGGWVHLEARGTNQLAQLIFVALCNVRDITEQKQAELKYHTLLDKMLDGFAACTKSSATPWGSQTIVTCRSIRHSSE